MARFVTRALRGAALALVLALVLARGDGSMAGAAVAHDASLRLEAIGLRDDAGRVTSMQAWRGRWVVVNLWATWCAPCRRELPSLGRFSEAVAPEGVAVLLLTLDDDPQFAIEYLRQRSIGLPNYVPLDRARAKATLVVDAVPTTLIVAPDGRVTARIMGPRSWEQPDIVAAFRAMRTHHGSAARRDGQ